MKKLFFIKIYDYFNNKSNIKNYIFNIRFIIKIVRFLKNYKSKIKIKIITLVLINLS
jgi:hypothetical protein